MCRSATGNRTPGIAVTGRDVTNYTIADYLYVCMCIYIHYALVGPGICISIYITNKHFWPSGLRRQVKALVSSEAWVQIPQSA